MSSGGVRNISDEVFPGIIVGGKAAARNKDYLLLLGVTHVLNTAEGNGCNVRSRMTVNTGAEYYRPAGIQYMGLRLLDVSQTNISEHFDDIIHFIDSAISGGGKILVNCHLGVSRSPTCVLAYLITKHNMTVAQAVDQVRKHRMVKPNEGFLKQLTELDVRLRDDSFAGLTGKSRS